MLFVEVRIKGQLAEHWAHWFDDLAIAPAGAETRLAGLVPDQAALYGLLGRLRDLAIPLQGVDSVALPAPVSPGGGRLWGCGAVDAPAEGGWAEFSLGLSWEAGGADPAGQLRFHCPAAGLHFVSGTFEHVEAAGALVRCQGTGRLNAQAPGPFRLAVCAGSAADGLGRWRLRLAAPGAAPALYDTERGRDEGLAPAARLTAGRILMGPAGGQFSAGR